MSTPSPRDGVLPIDKPVGPTSHDVVGTVRRALRTRRVGHTGTLDPFASGLLLVCTGNATRIAEYLTGLDKRYHARVRLGIATDTDDNTGSVLTEADPSQVTPAAVEDALAAMTGMVLQRPPAYSAKKVAGERAYAAARAGRALELEPVPVRIDELRIVSVELPYLELDVACGSGTYIRAIARDLGEALGVGGHLTALRRTAVGEHHVDGALDLGELGDAERVNAAMIPAAAALVGMPQVLLNDDQLRNIRHGRAIHVDAATGDGAVALLHGGDLVAVGIRGGNTIRPRKVFA
jgi:tRNA pseudouridine55 synthase